MLSELEIRRQLADYIRGQLSYDDFESWLLSRSRDMHKDSTQNAQDLVSDINLLIYEYLDGHINEIKLKRDLRLTLEQPYRMHLSFEFPTAPAQGQTFTRVMVQSAPHQAAELTFDIPREWEFGSSVGHPDVYQIRMSPPSRLAR